MTTENQIVESNPMRDHGGLPDWDQADMPEPLPFSVMNLFRTIGPGAILLAAAIGGGEWIAGPTATVKFGRGILWVATVAVFLQTIFNLEAIRYTLYTGEPILTGFMRLNPGPRFWATFYILIGVAQLATPALAAACGSVIVAIIFGPEAEQYQYLRHWFSTGIILFTVALLLSGRSIELVLERLSWGMIVFIFTFLISVNLLLVPPTESFKTMRGFIGLEQTLGTTDLVLLATFAATAGSGGLGNLAITNWFRDKGFGMGALSGKIGNALAGEESHVRPIGTIFPMTAGNLKRWKIWWRYAAADQVALWAFGCMIGMFLNVNLAAALIVPNADIEGGAGVYMAKIMSERFWSGLWMLALVNGFWILFSTHLGNTDVLVRIVSDISWDAFPKI